MLCTTLYQGLRTSTPGELPSLQGGKSDPNPKFLGATEAYFVCHNNQKFMLSLGVNSSCNILLQARRKRGGWGGFSPLPVFGRTVNPISTRGADYAHQSTISLQDL